MAIVQGTTGTLKRLSLECLLGVQCTILPCGPANIQDEGSLCGCWVKFSCKEKLCSKAKLILLIPVKCIGAKELDNNNNITLIDLL